MPTPSQLPIEARIDARTITFLNLLRGCAVLLVMYDHLGAVWPGESNRSWIVNRVIRRWINEPLGIIQDFGFLGVTIFFLVSGFIITHVAQRETRFQFATKRILRIYPPLIVSILVIAAIAAIRGVELLPIGDYLTSFTLVNYLQSPQVVVSGVAWTLVIEMLFYAAIFATLPLVQSRPLAANAIILVTVVIVICSAREFGASYFLFAASISYLPFLLIGQLIYLRWVRRITVPQTAVLTALTYGVAVFAIDRINSAFLLANNSYMISAGFAVGLFLVALSFEGSFRIPKFIALTSEISYSLYLLHGVIGYFTLDKLVGKIPFTAAFIVAVGTSLISAYVAHRFIELPSQRAARWIIAKAPAKPDTSRKLNRTV